MKTTLGLAVILAVMCLMTIPVQAAGVHNISLPAVGSSGVTGTATTIVGDVAGPNPYHNVEVNINMDKAPAANMVYEAWLIDCKDNVTKSIGAFNGTRFSTDQHMVHFEDNMPFDQIAVSQEPAHDPNPMPATIVAQAMLPGTPVTNLSDAAVLPQSETFQRQALMRTFNLTGDQYASLRMQGFTYADVAMVGNAAQQCKKSPNDIAMMLSQGQTWDQIASSCNVSTAMLFQPFPAEAVAGSEQQIGAMPAGAMAVPNVQMPVYYRKYPNGRPVVDQYTWEEYRDRGYSWHDVAVAANISAETGEPLDRLLREESFQGKTWDQIAMERGIRNTTAMDVSKWPFGGPGAPTMAQPSTTGAAGTSMEQQPATTTTPPAAPETVTPATPATPAAPAAPETVTPETPAAPATPATPDEGSAPSTAIPPEAPSGSGY